MPGVVMDPGHHVRAAEALRILERRVRDELAGFEIDQPDDDGGRPEVDREAVNRTGRAGDLFPGHGVDDTIALTHDRGIERRRLVGGRKVQRAPLDAHLAAAHRVALDLARRRRRPGTGTTDGSCARASRCVSNAVGGVSSVHPARDLDDAFLALALGDAGRRDANAGLLGGSEERHPRRCRDAVSIDGEGHAWSALWEKGEGRRGEEPTLDRKATRRFPLSSPLSQSRVVPAPLELALDGARDLLGGAFPLLFVAPSPLGEVFIMPCNPRCAAS